MGITLQEALFPSVVRYTLDANQIDSESFTLKMEVIFYPKRLFL
jgi:hypothetical protein